MLGNDEQAIGYICIYAVFVDITEHIAVNSHFFGVSADILYPEIPYFAFVNG